MARSNAMIGYGTTWEMAHNATPDVVVSLSELINITTPVETDPTVDVTHMQSPNRQGESIAGMGASAEASVEGNYIPSSVTDLLLTQARGAGRYRVRVTYPNGAGKLFDASRTTYGTTTPVADRMTFNAAFATSGGVIAVPIAAPRNLVVPVLMNAAVAPKVGGIIELEDGDWAGAMYRTIKWEISDTGTATWTPIPNASGLVYIPTAAQVGKFIRASVEGSNDLFSTVVETASTIAVVA